VEKKVREEVDALSAKYEEQLAQIRAQVGDNNAAAAAAAATTTTTTTTTTAAAAATAGACFAENVMLVLRHVMLRNFHAWWCSWGLRRPAPSVHQGNLDGAVLSSCGDSVCHWVASADNTTVGGMIYMWRSRCNNCDRAEP
jgi:hypothetical protein